MNIKTIAVAAFAAATLAAPSMAATTIDGTFAASIIGVSSSTASIGVGSTFTNTVLTVIGSTTGDFNGTAGTNLTLSPVTVSNGGTFSFTSAIGSFTGKLSNIVLNGPTNNLSLSAYALGKFTPAGSLASYAVSPSSATLSFTQTGGAGGAVSGSFTFSSPPTGAVPEPASWAMLIGGFALTGVALRRRRTTVAA